MSTIIYLAQSEASSHSTHSKKVETKQKSEPKGSKMCFSRPNYKGASAMTTGQVLSHITAISCFVSVLGWKKCVSPPIALLHWKPCWFGSLTKGHAGESFQSCQNHMQIPSLFHKWSVHHHGSNDENAQKQLAEACHCFCFARTYGKLASHPHAACS